MTINPLSLTPGSGQTINTFGAGQANMANSHPGTIASDQSPFPVTAFNSLSITNPSSALIRPPNASAYNPGDMIAAKTSGLLTSDVPFFTIAGGVIIPRVRLSSNLGTAAITTPFVTGQTLGSPLRNDVNTVGGFAFTTGATPITITDLGRWVNSGNAQTHTLSITRQSDRALMCSVSLPLAGATPGAYAFGSCAPAVLAANTAFYFTCSEFAGGDTWNDAAGGNLTTTGVAAVNGWDYFDGSAYHIGPTANQSGGPLNFKYKTTSPINWSGIQLSVTLWSAAPTYTGADAQPYAPATGSANWLANFLVTLAQFGDGAEGVGPLTGASAMALRLASGNAVFWDLQTLNAAQSFPSQTFILTAECLN